MAESSETLKFDEKSQPEISQRMTNTSLEIPQASTRDTQNADSLQQEKDTKEDYKKQPCKSDVMAESSETLKFDEKSQPEISQRMTNLSLEISQASTQDIQNASLQQEKDIKEDYEKQPCKSGVMAESSETLKFDEKSQPEISQRMTNTSLEISQASTRDIQNADSLQQEKDTKEDYEKHLSKFIQMSMLLDSIIAGKYSNSDEKLQPEISTRLTTSLETPQASTTDTQNADSLQ